jgi:hypothetical protein
MNLREIRLLPGEKGDVNVKVRPNMRRGPH